MVSVVLLGPARAIAVVGWVLPAVLLARMVVAMFADRGSMVWRLDTGSKGVDPHLRGF